ncbi:MAG: molybdenum cofactor biosynthesis protein MoaE [Desulfomonilaceae bacterium]
MAKSHISLVDLIQAVKAHPNMNKAGMILIHNGIVRAFDKTGARRVKGVVVEVDHGAIQKTKEWVAAQEGIVAVAIEAFEGELRVGDDLLYIVLAGDIREHVIPVMREAIDRLKSAAVRKRELYEEG